jgi:adenylate kinase
MQIVDERLSRSDCDQGFLLDGIPRTVNQAEVLTHILAKNNRAITHVVQITVPQKVIVERIQKRGDASQQARTDDSAEVAVRRYQVYLTQTAPVAGFYKERNCLVQIDGVGAVEEVFERVCAALR